MKQGPRVPIPNFIVRSISLIFRSCFLGECVCRSPFDLPGSPEPVDRQPDECGPLWPGTGGSERFGGAVLQRKEHTTT